MHTMFTSTVTFHSHNWHLSVCSLQSQVVHTYVRVCANVPVCVWAVAAVSGLSPLGCCKSTLHWRACESGQRLSFSTFFFTTWPRGVEKYECVIMYMYFHWFDSTTFHTGVHTYVHLRMCRPSSLCYWNWSNSPAKATSCVLWHMDIDRVNPTSVVKYLQLCVSKRCPYEVTYSM